MEELCVHGCVGVSDASTFEEENSMLMSSLLLKDEHAAGSKNEKEINGCHCFGTNAQ